MDAIEGYRDVGQLGSSSYEKFQTKDRLKSLLDLVRRESCGSGDWGGDEFDGIRSEVDFRRAMALEEERLRGTWTQRTLRILTAFRANFLNSRALRLLR